MSCNRLRRSQFSRCQKFLTEGSDFDVVQTSAGDFGTLCNTYALYHFFVRELNTSRHSAIRSYIVSLFQNVVPLLAYNRRDHDVDVPLSPYLTERGVKLTYERSGAMKGFTSWVDCLHPLTQDVVCKLWGKLQSDNLLTEDLDLERHSLSHCLIFVLVLESEWKLSRRKPFGKQMREIYDALLICMLKWLACHVDTYIVNVMSHGVAIRGLPNFSPLSFSLAQQVPPAILKHSVASAWVWPLCTSVRWCFWNGSRCTFSMQLLVVICTRGYP